MTAPAPPSTPDLEPITAGYAPGPGAWDECIDANGQARPAWQHFARHLDRLGRPALAQRWSSGQRLIADNGITYHVYEDPRGTQRPWSLDPLPMLITPEEWQGLEAGVAQRARVLNAVLGDLYGEQRLLQSGHIPAAVIYANPHFLRPCRAIQPPGDRHLVLYAVDVARNPKGQWWVVADRAQAPSGSGYALENRIVTSRVLPDLFRDSRVQRLAMFYIRLREALFEMAPSGHEKPRVVVLTPGPHNETYFEHAYLARYLGFTLVEGGDLTVRDNGVFLKTLGGLQRVDVILRRVDDEYCDPLELRGDSMLGVPGLVAAAAAGQVTVANALGSSVVEGPALTPFLPGLCRELLGEELALPSVAVWWCGQAQEREHVLANLDSLIVKPAFPGVRMQPFFGQFATGAQRDELADRIRAHPHRYIAQESVSLSTVPVWTDGRIEPRHLMLRLFVATHRDGYTVMPGGLCRVSAAGDSMIVSMQRGGGSKDVWVLAHEPVSRVSLLSSEPDLDHEVSRGGLDLPSRVADSMFWLGRYVERGETLVRLLRAVFTRIVEETSPNGCPELPHLLEALSRITDLRPDPPIHDPFEDDEATTDFALRALLDAEAPGSLLATLGHARRLGSIVRDRISLDTWRTLAQLYRTFDEAADAARDPTLAVELIDRSINILAAVHGHAGESMTRGPGWRFMEIGRRVERGGSTATLLRCMLVQPQDDERPVLDAVLEICASRITYRARYRSGLGPRGTIDLLVLDESNPRSIAYQALALEDHIRAIDGHFPTAQRTAQQRLVLAMRSELQLAEVHELCGMSHDHRGELDALLQRCENRLSQISDRLTEGYLQHAQPTRSMIRIPQQSA